MIKREDSPAPKWIWLYVLVPVALLLLWFADLMPETGIWRLLAECGAVLAVCGLALVWVSANRHALTQINIGAAPDADSAVDLQESPVSLRQHPRRIRPQTVSASPTRLTIAR